MELVSGGGGESDPTNDGKTHLFIHVPSDGLAYAPASIATSGGAMSIDWGDGTVQNITTTVPSHTYAKGDYEIVMQVTNGNYYCMGTTFGTTSATSTNVAARTASMLRRAYFYDENLWLGTAEDRFNSILEYCFALEKAVFTKTTSMSANATNTFAGCYSLREIALPPQFTSFTQYAFRYCKNLSAVTIPSSMTALGSYTFNACINMGEVHFLPSTPPTSASSTWTTVPTTCKIYVPTGTLAAYQAAENYPDPATYTYVEE